MSNIHIIGETPTKPLIVTQAGKELAEQIDPKEVVAFMQVKAIAFDAIFYLLCYNDKTGKFKFPANKSKFTDKEYKLILDYFERGILQLGDGVTAAKFKANMEQYIPVVIKNLMKPA